LAVSAGDCKAGRAGVVAACFNLADVVWAAAEAVAAANINVAVSIGLMTLLKSIDATPIKHICWVDTNAKRVHRSVPEKVSLRHAEF
jgi:hypothetical protein